jgi:hypothetical protein
MPFPSGPLHARGLETYWIAMQRAEAQRHLSEARSSAFRAEWHFETALAALTQHGERSACEWLDIAFRSLESAAASRRYAKGATLMAVRGRFLDSWNAKRNREISAEAAERRRRLDEIVGSPVALLDNP